MKKTQWQFTHRPDNQADIKRILREAREDGLTLVEVKGGPDALRGVYLDAQTIEPNAKYWPAPRNSEEIDLDDLRADTCNTDGWKGPWRYYAAAAKRAHELFCSNLEAAQARPKREYPPTVSVRAAGPDLSLRPVNGTNTHLVTRQWLPKPGEWFTVGPRQLPERSGAVWMSTDEFFIGKTLECVRLDGLIDSNIEPLRIFVGQKVAGAGERQWIYAEDFAYLTPAQDPALQPYIPKVGDKFTAKAINPNALVEISENPHGDVLTCVSDFGSCLGIDFLDKKGYTITKKLYEFKKVEEQKPAEPYIPQSGDKFTVACKQGRERTAFTWAQDEPHSRVLTCDGYWHSDLLKFTYPSGSKSQLTTSAYEFKKVQS